MIKKILLSLAAIFLAYRSVELLKFLNNTNPTRFNWISIVAFSIILNLFVTGIFAFLGFAFSTCKILPNVYYEIKNSKNLSLVYNFFGVKYFKLLLLKFCWGKQRNRKKYFNGNKTGIENFEMQTRQSEFGHLAAFIAISIISFYLLYYGYVSIFLVTILINIIGNLYPIILQRHHRIQIDRLKILAKNK